jgi:hypothetical protein
MASPTLHLCVLFYVGMVCVIERAGAIGASLSVAVRLFVVAVRNGGAREIAEEVEGLAKGVLRAAVEAQRVHAVRGIAGEEDRVDMVRCDARVQKVSKAHRAVLWLPVARPSAGP